MFPWVTKKKLCYRGSPQSRRFYFREHPVTYCTTLKGTVQRDFLPPGFFIRRTSWAILTNGWKCSNLVKKIRRVIQLLSLNYFTPCGVWSNFLADILFTLWPDTPWGESNFLIKILISWRNPNQKSVRGWKKHAGWKSQCRDSCWGI